MTPWDAIFLIAMPALAIWSATDLFLSPPWKRPNVADLWMAEHNRRVQEILRGSK